MSVNITSQLNVGVHAPSLGKETVGINMLYTNVSDLLSDGEDYLYRNQLVWDIDNQIFSKVRVPGYTTTDYGNAVADPHPFFLPVNAVAQSDVTLANVIVASDVDNWTLSGEELFLLPNQNSTSENGIYKYIKTTRKLVRLGGYSDWSSQIQGGIAVWSTGGDTDYNSIYRLDKAASASGDYFFRKDDFLNDGKLTHTSDAIIGDGLSLNAGMRFASDVIFSDEITVIGNGNFSSDLTVTKDFYAKKNSYFTGTVDITDVTTMSDIMFTRVISDCTFASDVDFEDHVDMLSTLNVSSDAVFGRNAYATGKAQVSVTGTVNVGMNRDVQKIHLTSDIHFAAPSDIPGDGCTFVWLITSAGAYKIHWNNAAFIGLNTTSDTLASGKYYIYSGVVYSNSLYGNISEIGISTL